VCVCVFALRCIFDDRNIQHIWKIRMPAFKVEPDKQRQRGLRAEDSLTRITVISRKLTSKILSDKSLLFSLPESVVFYGFSNFKGTIEICAVMQFSPLVLLGCRNMGHGRIFEVSELQTGRLIHEKFNPHGLPREGLRRFPATRPLVAETATSPSPSGAS
jgi:hypothetical protein